MGFEFAFLCFCVFQHVSQTGPVLDCLSRDIQSKLAPFGPAKSWPNVVAIQVGLLMNVVRCAASVHVSILVQVVYSMRRTWLYRGHELYT
jgi:hypothetical protein